MLERERKTGQQKLWVLKCTYFLKCMKCTYLIKNEGISESKRKVVLNLCSDKEG